MDFASLVPLEGGWSGRTFLAEAAGQRQVVRIYPPAEAVAVDADAAVLRLVRGLLPVPEVLEVRPGDVAGDVPGLLITSFEPGERGDLVLPRLDDAGLRTLGERVGTLVATLGGMPMPRGGRFVDAGLRIAPWSEAGLPDDLPGLVERHERDLAATGWTPSELAGLAGVADDAQERLDAVDRHVLVHSDLNPKNLLVDPDTLEITAIVDWEYAHAGHPFTDLGNVLRFERQPAYLDAVLDAYGRLRGTKADDALALARSADLWALVDLAARVEPNPVSTRAVSLLRAIARAGDVHADPG